VHESLRSTPAVAPAIADRVWTIVDLLDAALATQPIDPVVTAPDRRKRFTESAPPPSGDNPNHRADFNALLGKAVTT
jgi:hypothetical protein